MSEKYNGWTNYETWLVNLWIDNDQGLYEDAKDQAREGLRRGNSARKIGEDFGDQLETSLRDSNQWPEAGMIADIIATFWHEIDWEEIAEHWVEGMEEDAEEEETIILTRENARDFTIDENN